MKKQNNFFPEIFIPPDGLIRTPPVDKAEEYARKSNSIGSFSRDVYDLDICTLYRQMDDLKERYPEFAGRPFTEYLQQMRDNVKRELSDFKMDSEFYIDHFYYVIKPNHTAYITYLGLFLTMSNPLLIVPKLEHHLKQFLKHDLLGRGAENFLGEIEFTVCNAIRTARFPEDYHVKHDKIISWVYNKRESEQYRKEMNAKLDALILGINRISPKQKISKEVIRQKPGRKKGEEKEIFVLPKMVEQFITDLTGYLNKNSHDALRKILRGEAESALIVNFDGQARQLIDVFRIYTEAGYIKAEKRSVANWITKHFMYRSERLSGFVPFDIAATERVIYHYNPVDKDKRVNLKGLPKLQESYYTNRKKTYSDTNSYD